MKPFEIQVPGEALFIPVEKMLLVCQEELPFEGFFIDNRNQNGTFKRWKMEFHITLFPFVTGLGADDVGEFRWISRQRVINPERIRFIKEYTTHEVHYSGYLRGGVLFGTWYLPDDEDSFGRFAMWPKNYQNILEMNMKKMTKSEHERNELEKKLVFVGKVFRYIYSRTFFAGYHTLRINLETVVIVVKLTLIKISKIHLKMTNFSF